SVRGPGMQWRRSHLESKSAGDQPYSDQEERIAPRAAPRKNRSNAGVVCSPGDAIGQAYSVNQQRRREGAEEEVLDRSFVRRGPLDSDPDQDVGAERHEFQSQIERQ